jgi:hypothetical protein
MIDHTSLTIRSGSRHWRMSIWEDPIWVGHWRMSLGVLVAKICACKTLTNVLYHSGVWKLWRKHCRRDFFSWRRLITLDWRPDLGRDTDECFLVDPIWVGTLTNVLLRTVRDESYAGLTTRFGSGHWRMSLGRPDLGRDTDECLITYSGDESFRAMQLI